MRHVLGMAKSNLDLNGSKPIKLELDFLRLVYAVKALRGGGDEAQGYLIVVSAEVERRTRAWRQKYAAGDTVLVARAAITAEELGRREAEVLANTQSMVGVVLGTGDGAGSDASFGRDLGELALARLILSQEPAITRHSDEKMFPLRVKWDFYGTRA
jgi:hypothetical protein